MIKRLGFTAILGALLLSGCGGGGDNNSQSAENILKGKTFYYTDGELSAPDGYYKDIFNASSFIESEHSDDGTEIYTETIPITYSGNKITIDDDGHKVDCTVSANENFVAINCPISDSILKMWTTVVDAKANPQP